jgi:hypothetical protein
MIIVSSERDWLLVPNGFDERGQLATTLWDGVHDALGEEALDPPTSVDEMLQSARGVLDGGGRDRLKPHDAACPPLWMLVRRHPLRGQYLHQYRLLRHGRRTLGRVLAANQLLYRIPRDEARFDAPAIVIYAFDPADSTPRPELLERIAERFSDPLDAAAGWFTNAVTKNGGFPLAVPVPEAFSEGIQVYCTSVMVVRRHIPLESLRRAWLPLLVSPSERFSIVLPMRLWGPAMRAAWKRGGARAEGESITITRQAS